MTQAHVIERHTINTFSMQGKILKMEVTGTSFKMA
jgi:hypothetical protein